MSWQILGCLTLLLFVLLAREKLGAASTAGPQDVPFCDERFAGIHVHLDRIEERVIAIEASAGRLEQRYGIHEQGDADHGEPATGSGPVRAEG